MERLFDTAQETAAELPRAGRPASGGGRAARGRGIRFFLALLALLAAGSTVLAVRLGTELRQARNEISQLRYPAEPEPPSPQDPLPADVSLPEEDDNPGPEHPAYQDLYPELYAQPHQWNSLFQDKAAYLTFDDGPSARTPEVLEILDRYGVKGTFFVVGSDTEQARQWMRDIVAAGHTIGVHSYTHDYEKVYSSVEAYLDDFAQIYDLIRDATGVAPQIFRFPGGSINAYNGQIYQEIVSEMTRRGFVYYDWNRMTGDAVRRTPSAAVLAQNALSDIKSASRIILLAHDSKRYTNMVAALPSIIEGYQAAGFTLEALTPEVRPIIYAYPNPG